MADAHELGKRWLVALIASSTLAAAAHLPMTQLAGEAPELCAQIARALETDADLARLAPGGDLEALARRSGLMAGASDVVSAVAVIEVLRGVLWTRLLVEMREPGTAEVIELADRLARVLATVTAAAVDGVAESGRVSAGRVEPRAVDDGPWPPHGPSSNGHEGPVAWIGSIGRRLESFGVDGRPFGVMLIEVADLERLRRAESESVLSSIFGEVERALRGELRAGDVLTRESAGRFWLVSPGSGRAEANSLAERLAQAVRSRTSHRGAPLALAIGSAVCPDDGREAAALAARADVGMYAARAAGRPLAPRP